MPTTATTATPLPVIGPVVVRGVWTGALVGPPFLVLVALGWVAVNAAADGDDATTALTRALSGVAESPTAIMVLVMASLFAAGLGASVGAVSALLAVLWLRFATGRRHLHGWRATGAAAVAAGSAPATVVASIGPGLIGDSGIALLVVQVLWLPTVLGAAPTFLLARLHLARLLRPHPIR